MSGYRFRRRAFLGGVGGAFGLKALLRTMEAAAQGATSPPRLLMTHWPIGTYRQSFLPTGTATAPILSPILAPFQSLLADTIILYGFRDGLSCPGGGGHEAGTPFTTTGASAPGTRANNGEADDGVAGGPSWDQILLNHPMTGLKIPGPGYQNVLCDARVDSLETSTQCLSYGYATRSIAAAVPAGTNITEYTPLTPELSPANAFTTLFTGFMPGGSTPANQEVALRGMRARKSVLDHCLRELNRLKTLAPASQADKIEIHATSVRNVETQLTGQIAMASMGGGTGTPICTVPASPPATLKGQTGSRFNYGNEMTTASDEGIHEMIGKAHAAVLLAAFQCDIIRVASFQWSPGTNHVSFTGKYPAAPANSYMHHPMSHRIGDTNFFNGPPLTGTSADASLYQFLVAVQTWYNQKTADILTTFKAAKDAFGNSILDHTVVPYMTEVGDPSHNRSGKASLIFGGRALGMRGNQFQMFNNRPQVDVWLSVAQAFLKTNNPLPMLPTTEKFSRTGAGVINGLWAAPV